MEFQAVIWKDAGNNFLNDIRIIVTTQGNTIEESIANIKDAVGLYLEEMPDAREELENKKTIGAVSVEIAYARGNMLF